MIDISLKKPSFSSFTLLFSAVLRVINLAFIFSLFSTNIAAQDLPLPNNNLSASKLHIRTLAASCAACHGTNGNANSGGNALAGNAVLAGIDKNYFTVQMLAFKNGERQATVMHRHAKGLQVDEINQLADYFSAQKRVSAISPKPQLLKAYHE